MNFANTNPDGSIDVEVFAVGRWNGISFDNADLNRIVEAFESLQDIHHPPLKFGHNDEQKMTDGQPAIGWVKKVWKDGEKLFAKFVDVPRIVYDAIQKRLYRHVSVELDKDVKHGGTEYPWVLSGVALLGADLPAVNTIGDLKKYMSRGDGRLEFTRRVYFSFNVEEEHKMADRKEDDDDLREQNYNLRAEVRKLKEELEAQKSEYKKLSKKFEERDKEDKERRVAAKRKEIDAYCESAVNDGYMEPSDREAFKRSSLYDNDDLVIHADLDALKVPYESKKTVRKEDRKFSKDSGNGAGSGEGGEGESAAKKAIRMARDRQATTKEPFGEAFSNILRNNEGLAREYQKEMNEEAE